MLTVGMVVMYMLTVRGKRGARLANTNGITPHGARRRAYG